VDLTRADDSPRETVGDIEQEERRGTPEAIRTVLR
jgi:hypothetical protein